MDSIYEFVKKYYIDSIVFKQGYNVVNTFTWALILIIAVILIYKTLKRFDLDIDLKFALGNIPYILLGSSARVIEDAGFLNPPTSYFFMTPLIYILIFLIAFPTLILSLKFRRENYWIHYGTVGLTLSIVVLIMLFTNLQIVNWWILPLTIFSALSLTVIYHFASEKLYPPMDNQLSKLVFFSQMADGFATFLGIQFLGYWELHVLPRFLISTFGPWIMVPAKIIIFLAILYFLDSMDEDDDFKNFVKFVLIVLGLAPGIRDMLRMSFST